jgi:uracil-DNA glycosylase family 4
MSLVQQTARPEVISMTLWEQFVQRWGDCTVCELHKSRSHVVLARGQVPCDVVLCAEAPGHSEDALGLPMVGPAGYLMDQILERSLDNYEHNTGLPRPSWSMCNLVCCIPTGEDGNKTEEPPVESIRACAPRLREFLDLCRPRLIVCVGKLAETWLDSKLMGSVFHLQRGKRTQANIDRHWAADVPRIKIDHPAFLLRTNQAVRGLAVQRCVVNLVNALEEFVK